MLPLSSYHDFISTSFTKYPLFISAVASDFDSKITVNFHHWNSGFTNLAMLCFLRFFDWKIDFQDYKHVTKSPTTGTCAIWSSEVELQLNKLTPDTGEWLQAKVRRCWCTGTAMSWVVPQLSLLQAFNCHHFTTVSSDFISLPDLGLIKLCHQTGTVIILNKLGLSFFMMQQPCTVDNLGLSTVYQATTVCQPCINSNFACLVSHTQTVYYLELSVECFKLCHPHTVYIYTCKNPEISHNSDCKLANFKLG